MASCDVTVLVDDMCSRRGLRGEHGLALLVEREGRRVLYDVGQSGLFLENARSRGLDLATVDAVVLSHGHYDHLGGLEAFLAFRGGEVDVYCHHDAFRPRLQRLGGRTVGQVGSPVSRERLEELGARFHFVGKDAVEVVPGITVSGEVPRDAGPENLIGEIFVRREEEEKNAEQGIDDYVVDPLLCDLFLLVSTDEGVAVLTGCAHAGLENILAEAERLAGGSRIVGLMGGFHLFRATAEELLDLVSHLETLGLRRLVPLHCSGFLARTELRRHLPEITMLASTGDRILFA